MRAPDISIVVSNWEGEGWIVRSVSSALVSARACGRPFELLVVDGNSSDDSAALVREHFPQLQLVVTEKIAGRCAMVNAAARLATGRVLVHLSSEHQAQEGFVAAITEPLLGAERRGTFAVSARTMRWHDGVAVQRRAGLVWRGGRLTPAWAESPERGRCLVAEGGAVAYDRARFLALGGFDGLFEEGPFADEDLSLRAARRGWELWHEPSAVAISFGEDAFARRYPTELALERRRRNHLLLDWRHLRSPLRLAEHALRLPLALAGRRGGGLARALSDAAPLAGQVWKARRGDTGARRGDGELLRPWSRFKPSV